jgi:SAM-dependent methyltransferase
MPWPLAQHHMDNIQNLQAQEYSFPYHYIPIVYPSGRYALHRKWGYAANWLAGFDLVRKHSRLSHDKGIKFIDLGCGDGALVNYLSDLYSGSEFIGIDYDKRAISFASFFKKPNVHFLNIDICSSSPGIPPANCLSLVEVIEHIPPDTLPEFLDSATSLLDTNGILLITVPHKNVPVTPKHYQHFSFQTLFDVVSNSFRVKRIFGFGHLSVAGSLVSALTSNKILRLDNGRLTQFLVDDLIEECQERYASRIFCIAETKSSKTNER